MSKNPRIKTLMTSLIARSNTDASCLNTLKALTSTKIYDIVILLIPDTKILSDYDVFANSFVSYGQIVVVCRFNVCNFNIHDFNIHDKTRLSCFAREGTNYIALINTVISQSKRELLVNNSIDATIRNIVIISHLSMSNILSTIINTISIDDVPTNDSINVPTNDPINDNTSNLVFIYLDPEYPLTLLADNINVARMTLLADNINVAHNHMRIFITDDILPNNNVSVMPSGALSKIRPMMYTTITSTNLDLITSTTSYTHMVAISIMDFVRS
jgi:hypothetical protein